MGGLQGVYCEKRNSVGRGLHWVHCVRFFVYSSLGALRLTEGCVWGGATGCFGALLIRLEVSPRKVCHKPTETIKLLGEGRVGCTGCTDTNSGLGTV